MSITSILPSNLGMSGQQQWSVVITCIRTSYFPEGWDGDPATTGRKRHQPCKSRKRQ